MSDMSFTFHLHPYDMETLLPQASKALEKRNELISRKKYPGLWSLTDQLNTMTQRRTRSKLCTRLLSILCLAVGIFLFVPGLMKPQELLVPLLAGAVALGAGIGGLWRSRKRRKTPFDKSAKKLLAGKDQITAEDAVMVTFSEDGMSFPTGSGNTESVPYSGFECAIETADLFLFVYGERITVLQKTDLTEGDIDNLCILLSEQICTYHTIP